MKRALVTVACLLSATIGRDALGSSACASAADAGQDLRAEGRLAEARATFLFCAKRTCNKVVRSDCQRWIEEIDAELRAPEPDETEEPKQPPAPPAPAPPEPARTPVVAVAPPAGAAAPAPIAPLVLGGIGVASLATFVFFQVEGSSRYAALEDGCGRTRSCTDADIAKVRSQFVASGVALGVSVVALGAAAVLYLTRGGATSSRVGITASGAAVSF